MNDLKNFVYQQRGQAHGRFVQQQHLRPGHQCTANRQHLLLAARERPSNLLAALLQAWQPLEYGFIILVDAALIIPDIGAHLQVLLHRHPRKDPAPFRNLRQSETDDFMRVRCPQVLTAKGNLSRFCLDQPADGMQCRRLARAICTDQCDNLPFVYLKGDALDRMDRPIVDLQILHRKHSHVFIPLPDTR